MKRKIVYPVIVAAVIAITGCGCSFATAAFDQKTLTSNAVPYSFPVKFYLKEFVTQPYQAWKGSKANNILISKVEMNKIRAAFVKYHPELFTNSEQEGLHVSLRIKAAPKNSDPSTTVTQGLNALLSLCSCFIIPLMTNSSQNWHIEMEIENLKNTADWKILLRQNVGFFGTAYLLPDLPNHSFKAETDLGPWTPAEERMRQLVQIFVNELYTFPPNDIQELYLKKKTKHIQLLE